MSKRALIRGNTYILKVDADYVRCDRHGVTVYQLYQVKDAVPQLDIISATTDELEYIL